MPKGHYARSTQRGVTPKQILFIDWLCWPKNTRNPSTQLEWCKQNQVANSTAIQWKQDASFRKEWDARLRLLHVNPERIDEVLDSMHDRATRGQDVAAAKLWLEVAGAYQPKQVIEVDDKRDLKELSDDELDALIHPEVVDELAVRRTANG